MPKQLVDNDFKAKYGIGTVGFKPITIAKEFRQYCHYRRHSDAAIYITPCYTAIPYKQIPAFCNGWTVVFNISDCGWDAVDVTSFAETAEQAVEKFNYFRAFLSKLPKGGVTYSSIEKYFDGCNIVLHSTI